jgi:hypothetical protein
MSSSRSIAAARQRRAGDIVQKQPVSIRQQQQQMMGQRPNPNQRMTNPAATYNAQMMQQPGQQRMMQPQQQQAMMQQQMQQQQQYGGVYDPNPSAFSGAPGKKPKIEVGTAIGLVTLRLGRVEQFIQQISENGHIKKDLLDGTASLPDNSKIVDNSVFTSLMSRVDAMESKLMKANSHEGDLKSMKDMLLNLNASLEKQVREINERLMDFEAAIVDIENKMDTTLADDGMIASANYFDDNNPEEGDGPEGISYEISEE